MFLIREPSSIKGNVGDSALIKSIELLLSEQSISYKFLDGMDNNRRFRISKFRGLIYFGNDTIAYYGINKKLINQFIKLNKPVFIINLSFGENIENDYLLKISKYQKLFLWARDIYSYNLLNNFANFKNEIRLTSDIAYNLPFYIDKVNNWIEKRTKKIIAINIHQDFNEFNQEIYDNFLDFLNKNKETYDYIFIPHDSRKKTELNSNERLFNNFKKNSLLLNCIEPSHEVAILDHVYAVITCRMHLGILSIGSGKPAIIIEYNGVKAKGQLEHWGLEEDLLLFPETINTLSEKFDNLVSNYKEIINKISINKQKILDMSTKSFQEISTIYPDISDTKKQSKFTTSLKSLKTFIRFILNKIF